MPSVTLNRADWRKLPPVAHYIANGKPVQSLDDVARIMAAEGFGNLQYFINAWAGYESVGEELFNFSIGE